jgi:hypothetical protein
MEARIGVAERDVADSEDVAVRLEVARRLLVGAGFDIRPTPPNLARDGARVIVARLGRG